MGSLGLDRWIGRVAIVVALVCCAPGLQAQTRPEPPPKAGEANVAEVRIVGSGTPANKLPRLSTRAGQPFDPKIVEDDVRALDRTRRFIDIRPKYQRTPEGIVVIFDVIERPVVREIKYVGNKGIKRKKLEKQHELKVGDALDPHMIEDARRRIEEHYHGHGFTKARVATVEGTKPGESTVVFLINEGNRQRVWWTQFEGNTVATDSRLRTQVQSKPGILWFFGGYVDPKKIDEDIERLTAYYRSLGFFKARVSRVLEYDEDRDWLTISYVIDEGTRYKVRNVSVVGNETFASDELQQHFELKSGDHFDQAKLNKDINGIRDHYGTYGYIFADVKADTRFVEDQDQPGLVDLVYDIGEGDRYKIGRVDVKIGGDYAHTRDRVVRNRLSIMPGHWANTAQIRRDETRIKRSQVFENNPTKGSVPKIVVVPPAGIDEEQLARKPKRSGAAASGSSFRGQSPDPVWPPRTQDIQQHAASRPIYRAQDAGYGGSMVGATGPDARPASAYRPSSAAMQSISSGGAPAKPIGNLGPASSVDQRYFDPSVTPTQYLSPGPAGSAPAKASGSYGTPVMGPGNYAPPGGYVAVPPQPQAAAGMFAGPPVPVGDVGPIPAEGAPVVSEQPGAINYEVYPEAPEVDINASVTETQTGRIMFGVGVNSNAGLIGNIVLDEQNFDITRWPTSWSDWPNAFRGNGQRFRLEAAPGTQVSRYVISFQEPYLNDWPISFSTSASYYQRFFRDWYEERTSGRFGLGYQIPYRPDISINTGLRLESVEISRPRIPTPPELTEVLGQNTVVGLKVGIAHDTRDSPFLPTEGFFTNTEFEQVFGSFTYPRFTVEASRYFTLHQRIDGSGRQVLKVGGEFGVSGEDAPIYDRFFAGGYNTLRGFKFRGASPRTFGVAVGGRLQLLGTVEYMFPITADDMLRGVVFTDFGTVERDIEIEGDNFRAAPGFGLRITVPALGPAPLAFDFAFPVLEAPGDEDQIFAFFVGINR